MFFRASPDRTAPCRSVVQLRLRVVNPRMPRRGAAEVAERALCWTSASRRSAFCADGPAGLRMRGRSNRRKGDESYRGKNQNAGFSARGWCGAGHEPEKKTGKQPYRGENQNAGFSAGGMVPGTNRKKRGQTVPGKKSECRIFRGGCGAGDEHRDFEMADWGHVRAGGILTWNPSRVLPSRSMAGWIVPYVSTCGAQRKGGGRRATPVCVRNSRLSCTVQTGIADFSARGKQDFRAH